MKREQTIPGPDGGPLGVDVLRAFRSDPLRYFDAQRSAHGDLVRLPFGTGEVHLLAHPDLVREAIVEQGDRLVKWRRLVLPFERVAACNLVILEGEPWAEVRRVVEPALLSERLGAQVTRASSSAAAWCAGWREGEAVAIDAAFSRVHRDNLVEGLLGIEDVTRTRPELAAALDVVMGVFMAESQEPVHLPEWLPTPNNIERRRAHERIDAALAELIRERRASGGARGDVLSTLVHATAPQSGRSLRDEEIAQLVLSLFVAGRETPVRALTWTLALLARHPAAQAQLHRALDAAGAPRSVEDLRRMPYLFQVLHEALRCYPPAWSLVFREAVAPLQLGGHTLPTGSVVYICTHLLHHDARFWPEPERFDPERFAAGWEQRVPQGAYVPFGLGPRACAGRHLALLEVAATVAAVLQRYRLLPVGDAAEPKAAFTLQPALPLHVLPQRR